MTREIEARLRLSAVDRTASAFSSVGWRMNEIERKAKAINAASGKMAAVQTAAVARIGRVLGPALGGMAARSAYLDFASFDRKMTDIGVTADATKEELEGATVAVRAISQASAMPVDQTVEGLDSLVAAGRKLPDAMAFLPSVVRTARAASAEVVDIARSADAMGESFKIASSDMEKAFDVVTFLGKEGKFELKDQARYLPSIAPLAATRRLDGIDGLTRIGAALQVIRKNAGTAEEAAASMTDVLGKLDSDETIKKFMKKFDIDLPAALKKAKKEGKNTFEAFIDIVEKAIGGDTEKINQIFADKEARRGLTALIQYRQEYFRLIEAARAAPGTVRADEAKKIGDAQAAVDRLANSFKASAASAGRLLDAAGVTTFLDAVAAKADTAAVSLEGLGDHVRDLGSLDGFVRWLANGPDAASEMARDLRVKAATDPNGLQAVRYGASPPPLPGIWGEMGRREQIVAQESTARRDALRRSYPLPEWAPSTDVPADDLERMRRTGLPQPRPRRSGEVGGITPMPRPRPDPLGLEVMLDDASVSTLDSEIERQRARLQSHLDANPLILRARVDTSALPTGSSRAPLDTGRSFSNGNFGGAP